MICWKRYFEFKERLILWIILIFGLLVRLITIISTELFRDEVYAFFVAKENSLKDILLVNHWDTCHPPLYFAILHFWQKINYHPVFLRLPSFFFSVFILYLIPILAKKIYRDSKTFPPFSLFLFSLSQFQITLNILVKNYSLAILLTLLSLILFFEIIEQKYFNYKQVFILIFYFGLVNFLLFFTLYGGIYLILVYGIFILFYSIYKLYKKRFSEKELVLLNSFLFSLSLILLWVPKFLSGFRNCQSILSSEDKLSINSLIDFFYQFNSFNELQLTTRMLRQFFLGVEFKILSFVFISFLGIIYLLYKKRFLQSILFSLLIVVPVILSFSISFIFETKLVRPRTIYMVNIALIFTQSFFLSEIVKKIKLIFLSIILVFTIDFFTLFPYLYYTDPPYDWLKFHNFFYLRNTSKKIIYTFAPFFFFEHIRYYNLFFPIKNLEIVYLKNTDTVSLNLNQQKYKIYFVDFLSLDKEKLWTPKGFNYNNFLKCKAKEINLNYIFLVECQ